MPNTENNPFSPNDLLEFIRMHLADELLDHSIFRNQLMIDVQAASIKKVMEFLKTNSTIPFSMLTDITAMDYLEYPQKTPTRFAVLYVLYTFEKQTQVIVRAFIGEDSPKIDSIVPLFQGAEWPEREVYDLFGIEFIDHPDLRRILVPEYFKHHPLRKDYPVQGLGERSQFKQLS